MEQLDEGVRLAFLLALKFGITVHMRGGGYFEVWTAAPSLSHAHAPHAPHTHDRVAGSTVILLLERRLFREAASRNAQTVLSRKPRWNMHTSSALIAPPPGP